MIFESYKSVHSIELFFTGDEILNFLIREAILKIINVCTVYTNILREMKF